MNKPNVPRGLDLERREVTGYPKKDPETGWPLTGGKNLARCIEQVAHRVERLGRDRHAAPLGDLCEELDLPLTSFYALEAQGKGPRTFKLGRRRYARLEDWRRWLDERAEASAD